MDTEIEELQKANGNLKQRVAKLERAVTFLLGHAGVAYVDNPDQGPFTDVAALVYSGKKIEAIKLYRQKTGASMADAQKFTAEL